MARHTTEIGKMTCNTGSVKKLTQTSPSSMRENISKGKNMEQGFTTGMKALNTKANFSKIKCMEKENILTQMVEHTLEIG